MVISIFIFLIPPTSSFIHFLTNGRSNIIIYFFSLMGIEEKCSHQVEYYYLNYLLLNCMLIHYYNFTRYLFLNMLGYYSIQKSFVLVSGLNFVLNASILRSAMNLTIYSFFYELVIIILFFHIYCRLNLSTFMNILELIIYLFFHFTYREESFADRIILVRLNLHLFIFFQNWFD